MSFRKGYDALESAFAATPMLSPEGTVAGALATVTWFLATTLVQFDGEMNSGLWNTGLEHFIMLYPSVNIK